MPALPPNGFCLFAYEVRMKITGRRQSYRDDLITPYLVRIVTPIWERLTSEEKRVWKDQAKMKRHIEEYFVLMNEPPRTVVKTRKKQENPPAKQERQSSPITLKPNYDIPRTPKSRMFSSSTKRPAVNKKKVEKLDEFDENDYPEDSMIGIPLNQKDYDSKADAISELTYKAKYEKDKKRVLAFLRSLKGMEEVKRARFLFISMQTYGNVDGICIPAEIAICEFNLKHGIIDKFTSIIGPWRMHNEVQRRRAEFHASETHEIHLDIFSGRPLKLPTQKSCLREILGRCEPYIAQRQGVSVGLYRDGIAEFENDVEQPQTGTSCSNYRSSSSNYRSYDGYERKRLLDWGCGGNAFNNRMCCTNSYYMPRRLIPPQPIFASDRDGRRWLVCLNHEYDKIRASLEYLKKAQGLSYNGFPTVEDRFWYADAVVDALAEYAKGTPNPEYKLWLDVFGKKQPIEFDTPWERRVNVFCEEHTETRNCCCASATAIRSCFAMFFGLREPLSLTICD